MSHLLNAAPIPSLDIHLYYWGGGMRDVIFRDTDMTPCIHVDHKMLLISQFTVWVLKVWAIHTLILVGDQVKFKFEIVLSKFLIIL